MAEQPNTNRRRPTLNDLPESILIHILTMLPILSAIQTSFISRQWRNLWHSMPALKFDHEEDDILPVFSDDEEFDVQINHTISQILSNRPKTRPLRLLSLNFPYMDTHRSFVRTWIRYALDCNVEEMSLDFNGDDEATYHFHFSDISRHVVRCLKLWTCELVMPRVSSIHFDSLRVLYLIHVRVNDESLTDLISRCRNLENLLLSCFSGRRNFKVHSKSLKCLKLFGYNGVDHESSVEIQAPNLSKIKFRQFNVVNYTGDLPSVTTASLYYPRYMYENSQTCFASAMSFLRGVETVKIKGLLPRYEDQPVLPRFHLERVKRLEFRIGNTYDSLLVVLMLLQRAPALQTLVICNSPGDDEKPVSGEFNNLGLKLEIPSLQEVKMIGFKKTMFEHWILTLLRKFGLVTVTICIS